jgi:hypothetical protein
MDEDKFAEINEYQDNTNGYRNTARFSQNSPSSRSKRVLDARYSSLIDKNDLKNV